ncbi:hypothetical protein [Actinorugispora endophytica]|uniref:Uncharacterized protein n=1 Tax=Actinorugispora endophytica TaxID=1605990 RepID=A0A4R6V3H4_9ACTN|nr:hypothetical protein [Actinorugispora endophytica]TDQ53097.1 hypothetical protein EV190_105219 [Actinorugispora endophytica]
MAEESRLSREDIDRAERLRVRTAAAGRWYSGYLVVVGLLSAALVVAVEAFFPDGPARLTACGVWFLVALAAGWWAETRQVRPRGATRFFTAAGVVWLVGYLLLVGPLVRWRFDDSLVAWSLASAALSLPFAAAALWMRGRNR